MAAGTISALRRQTNRKAICSTNEVTGAVRMSRISVPKRDGTCTSLAFPRKIYFLGPQAISKFMRFPSLRGCGKIFRIAANSGDVPVSSGRKRMKCNVGQVSSCETLGHCGGRCAARGRRGACRRKADHRQSAVQVQGGEIRQESGSARRAACHRAARPQHSAPGRMRARRFAPGSLRSQQHLPAGLSPGDGTHSRAPAARSSAGRRRWRCIALDW